MERAQRSELRRKGKNPKAVLNKPKKTDAKQEHSGAAVPDTENNPKKADGDAQADAKSNRTAKEGQGDSNTKKVNSNAQVEAKSNGVGGKAKAAESKSRRKNGAAKENAK
jgi:ribosomal RNA methyltransferase Nop2